MNIKFLLFAISLAALASCSSAYRSGQTPDDVYYSPSRSFAATTKTEKRQEPREEAYYMTNEDRIIRIGINDYRYRYLDYDYNYDYSYNPYMYGYNYGYYYNPHYYPYPVYSSYITPVAVKPTNTTPRKVNLASYNSGYNTVNTVTPAPTRNTTRAKGVPSKPRYSNSNVSNNNTNNDNNSNRTYTPAENNNNSGSSTRSSSGSSNSGSSISRPARRGN